MKLVKVEQGTPAKQCTIQRQQQNTQHGAGDKAAQQRQRKQQADPHSIKAYPERHMTIKQLGKIMHRRFSIEAAQQMQSAFQLWQGKHTDRDVGSLLRRPKKLLRKLDRKVNRGSGFTQTAEVYLSSVLQALQLPEVQRLLNSEQEARQLRKQIRDAMSEFASPKVADEQLQAAAAAAAAPQQPAADVLAASTAAAVTTNNDLHAAATTIARAGRTSHEEQRVRADQGSKRPAGKQHHQRVERPPSKKQRTVSPADHNSSSNSQQQSQQRPVTVPSEPALTAKEVHQIMVSAYGTGDKVRKCMTIFRLWSKACDQNDLRSLLPRFEELIQHLTSPDLTGRPSYAAGTIKEYMYNVRHLLASPELQQQLDKQQVATVLQQAREVLDRNPGRDDATRSVAAYRGAIAGPSKRPQPAAAAEDLSQGSSHDDQQRQQQQRKQHKQQVYSLLEQPSQQQSQRPSQEQQQQQPSQQQQQQQQLTFSSIRMLLDTKLSLKDNNPCLFDDCRACLSDMQQLFRTDSFAEAMEQFDLYEGYLEHNHDPTTAAGYCRGLLQLCILREVAPGLRARGVDVARRLRQLNKRFKGEARQAADSGGAGAAKRQTTASCDAVAGEAGAAGAGVTAAPIAAAKPVSACADASLQPQSQLQQQAAAAAARAQTTAGGHEVADIKPTAVKYEAAAAVGGSSAASTSLALATISRLLQHLAEELKLDDSIHILEQIERYDYLVISLHERLRKLESDVQLEAAAAVLSWLLLLPSGSCRELMIDMLRTTEGWLDKLVQCWSQEMQLTGCSVKQAAEAAEQKYAVNFAGSRTMQSSSSRCTKGYLAGLCQLMLNVLQELCKSYSGEARGVATAAAIKSAPGTATALKSAAKDLLQGTYHVLLKKPSASQVQQHCTCAGHWRSCLMLSWQQCKADNGSRCSAQVQQRIAKVLQQHIMGMA